MMTIVKDENRDAMRRLLVYDAEVLGLAELAWVMGLSRQAMWNRIQRDKIPRPDKELAMSPIWMITTIKDWLRMDP